MFRPKTVEQSRSNMRGGRGGLFEEIVRFFETHVPPVSFMDAAQRSKAAGGRPMPLR